MPTGAEYPLSRGKGLKAIGGHSLDMSLHATDLEPGVNANKIVDRLSSSMSLGLLSVGERLPTEFDLAREFGVALATLRKALAVLRERGLVETRRGRSGGTFVVQAPFPTRQAVRDYLTSTSIVQLRDLGDEQVAVGVAIAKLACSRVYGDSFHRLGETAMRFEHAATARDRASTDSRFHVELAVLAQSPRLLRSEIRLRSEVSPLLWSIDDVDTPSVADDHSQLIEAIRSGESPRAESIVEAHIRKSIHHLIDAKLALDPRHQIDDDRDAGKSNS